VDVTWPISFQDSGWAETLRKLAVENGFQQNEFWIDLFLFHRGLYLDMPALVVGHCYWDNWMIWKALSEKVAVLDGTAFIMPVHQNHGYSAASQRVKGMDQDPLSLLNLQMIGGPEKKGHIARSTHVLGRRGKIYLNVFRHTYRPLRWLIKIAYSLWFSILDVTRPIRDPLGLRSRTSRDNRGKRWLMMFLVIAVSSTFLLWWVWGMFSRGEVPAGRGW
jgi:hypothetical protein